MTNLVKERLAEGRAVTMVNVDHVSPSLVEALGRLPVDAVMFDCQKGAPDYHDLEDMARAARLVGLTSIVRLIRGDESLVERTMLRGVDGIIVPRIEHTEQAVRVVDTVRTCFPRHHGDKLVIIQIETAGLMERLDETLAIEGIDAFLLGPLDLARSLGHAGDYRCKQMQSVIDRTIKRIRAARKPVGILTDRTTAGHYASLGVQLFYEHVNNFLQYGAESFAAALPPS